LLDGLVIIGIEFNKENYGSILVIAIGPSEIWWSNGPDISGENRKKQN
jgi:hypothetical protein